MAISGDGLEAVIEGIVISTSNSAPGGMLGNLHLGPSILWLGPAPYRERLDPGDPPLIQLEAMGQVAASGCPEETLSVIPYGGRI